ncbi:trans-Golgi network-localized SYP41-interacting protein 1 [Lactuca sativa]|uniref:Uncharacterized protein n=1 Tax=Lactuca sativa TaxID=4236 RepID=A0A9R1W450_LACSA|nr:trans-Golgi network-localized SYP41-interacting protein 1 [Lactuca sativa]KAJ0218146.1 hypothetical protein LSAT_V11C300113080 [Lactuca sativa]
MEEDSDLEHVTGSPTAGESGFVHVESINSASMDGSAIIQDDGVVVTRVDAVQDESSDLRMTDDGGNEEFVDCPDDLLSYDGRTDFDESQEAEEVVSEDHQHSLFDSEHQILPHHYQEERQQLMTELTNLRHKLKILIKKHPLIDGKDGALFTYELAAAAAVGDDKSLWPLHEMIFDCSRFIELALGEQSQTEHTVRELYATIDTKDKEINDLNVKIFEYSSVETTTDRILSSLAHALGVEESVHTSVSDKMLHLEKSISLLIGNQNHFLSEIEMLNQCLTELKRKELELTHKSSHIEDEYRKLMEHFERGREAIKMLNSEIGRLKGEVEVEKTRYSNTREKLNLAVTKGKSLVQQRDSLKQAVVEKTSELEKCLLELQEKSSALEAAELRKNEMLQFETLANSLKDQSFKLQDEINTMKEAESVKIDRLTVSLLIEALEKKYLEDEFADMTHKFEDFVKKEKMDGLELDKCSSKIAEVSEELCVLKDTNGCLKIDLQRSEDKVGLLKEKLSMAVKKGKGLVQEREIMKKQIAEKNAHIEALNLELKNQEDQISKLSSDVERIIKLESDLLHSKEERDQIEQFLVESNTILQQVIDATNAIVLPNDINDPVEKVKLCAAYLNECQVSKAQVEQELRDVKNEALKTTKSLEDALSISEKNMSQLNEEKIKLENLKTRIEEELHNAKEESCRTIKSLEDTVSQLQTHMSQFSHANETTQNNINLLESEIKKLKDEAAYHEHKFMDASETIKTLEDTLLKANNSVSNLLEEKKNAEQEISNLREELTCKTDDWPSELSSFLENLQMLLKDETLLILFKQSNEKKFETFIKMDHYLKDMKGYLDSEELQDYPDIEERFQLSTLFNNVLNTETTNSNEADAANIKSYAGKTLEKLNLRNQILTDEFIRFSTFIDELTTSLLTKLEAINNIMPITLEHTKTLQKNVDDLQIDKQVQEEKMLLISTEIKELQSELEKTRSIYDKVKEENDMLQHRVSKMETELEASQTMRGEMGIKLQDFQAKEDEWNRREAELSKQLTEFAKDHEAENKKGPTEASPLAPQSEISEVEDPVSIGKRSMSLVRSSRRGSNDHLALNIDQESDNLIDKQETVQDKGHIFKSLHTSGLVPTQGKMKMVADRLDGMWVSGGGALMSRPRARLGLIAYWVVLHLWLVTTLL